MLFRWCTDRAIGDDIVTAACAGVVETSPATAIATASIPAEDALRLLRFMNTSLSEHVATQVPARNPRAPERIGPSQLHHHEAHSTPPRNASETTEITEGRREEECFVDCQQRAAAANPQNGLSGRVRGDENDLPSQWPLPEQPCRERWAALPHNIAGTLLLL